MKRPIIVLFPIVTDLLLYASAVPLQQNRGNSVASHSDSSRTFPVDSSLTQRSDLDDVLSVLHPRTSVKDLLNPDPQTSPGASTSSASHGSRVSTNTGTLPYQIPKPHPGHQPVRHLMVLGVLPTPLNTESQPTSLNAPTSSISHTGSDITLPPINSFNSPQGFPHPNNIPANAGQFLSRHGAHAGPSPVAVHPQSATNFHQQYASDLVSSSPQSGPGDSSAPDDPDRLAKNIPKMFFSLRAGEVTGLLKQEIGGKRTLEEVGEEVVNGMLIIKTLFQSALEKSSPRSNSLLKTWSQKIDELSEFYGILTKSESRLVDWWNQVIHRQMPAMAKLYNSRDRQWEWDKNSWNDNWDLSTTQLMKGRETNRYRDFLRIMMGTRLARIEYIKQLESTPHTYEDLLELATTVEKSRDSNDINNALVMRRKAIQMWMLKGMSREEFVEQKKIVRRIVANLGEDNFNVVRAEMVIISLQRLMEAIKWKEP